MSKQVITLSDRAADRVKEIMAQRKRTNRWCEGWSSFRWMCRYVLRYGIC